MKVDWIWFDAVVRFMAGKVGRAQSCWPAPASHVCWSSDSNISNDQVTGTEAGDVQT